MVGAEPAWKIVKARVQRGEVDSVNSLTNNLLNRPEFRDVLPDDAMGFIDDMASRKLAQNAVGDVTFVGEVENIGPSSVFRRIELPALLENSAISPESRAQFQNMKDFLDLKYGK